jgi:2Fe-2S ferredoxin
MKRPTEPFNVTFHVEGTGETMTFRVDPARIPYGRIPLAGSILDIAHGAGIDIEHSCGGVCACSTCHVKVLKGGGSCSPATEDERDMLTTGRDVDRDSRLSCQCVPDGSRDLVVIVPSWFADRPEL